MLEGDLIKCHEAFAPVSDVPTTQSRSTDVFDIAIEFERRSAVLPDKLGTPLLISNLATIGFAIVHNFNLLDRSIRVQANRICNEFMFPDYLIDNEPPAGSDPPDGLLIFQHANTACLFDGLALRRGQFNRRGCEGFTWKDCLLGPSPLRSLAPTSAMRCRSVAIF
jgi:hypothetical protein